MIRSRVRLAWFASALIAVSLAALQPALGNPIWGFKWYSIGPQPSYEFFGGGETGRAISIAVNPANPDDIWIGTAGGGVWHSANGGALWSPMSDDQRSMAIGSLALSGCSSTGCSLIYAGTGENGIRRDTYYGAGLLEGAISAGSVAWTLRDGTPTYNFALGSIYNVVLDPTTAGSSQVLYITLSGGVTASATESTVTAPEPSPSGPSGGYGIYKSADNGATWTKLTIPGTAVPGGNGRPTDLRMDPTNSSILYAGFLGRGIFKSTDGGANWCPLNPGIPKPAGCPWTTGLPNPSLATGTFDHVEIDIYRGDHTHLYATLGNCPDRLVGDCEPSVYESTNSGINWTLRYSGSSAPTTIDGEDMACPRGYTRYTHALTISPSTPATLYIGGYHLCESDDNGQFWYAIDDFNTKGDYSTGYMLHPDHHALVFHATDFSRVYDVNDGGVAISTDGGTSWTPSTYGMDAIEFQSLATSPDTSIVFGGTQDNSGMIWTGSKQWTNTRCCGDGGFAAFETYNFGGFYNLTNMYITSNLGPVGDSRIMPLRSTDWGKTWPPPGHPPSSYDLGLSETEPRSFYPPLLNAGGYDLIGTNSLYTSVDQIHDWNLRSSPLSTDPESEIFGGVDVITAIAVAPSNNNRMYLGYYSGKVFYTDSPCSGPGCWIQVASPLPGAPVTWLAVDPGSQDTIYATTSGFTPGIHVFKSTTHGTSWNPTGSLAELSGVPANTIAIDPNSPTTLYLGTDHAIYRSDTSGASWYRFSNGLPNVPVYAIVFDASRNLVFAATHGRGAYTLGSIFNKTYVDGPVNKLVLDQPVFGGGYLPNQSCLMKVLRQDGSVCASGRTDALGGAIQTDAEGFLGSTRTGYFSDLPVVWACTQGNCLGTDVKNCLQAGNPIATLEVACGAQTRLIHPPSPNATSNPPSSEFTLGAPSNGPMGVPGSFNLLPAIQTGDGSSQILCSVNVPFAPSDTQGTVLQNAGAMVNANPSCQLAGVSAVIDAPVLNGEPEDQFPHPGSLSLSAPNVTGGTLIPGVQAAPGQATGACFSAGEVDDPLRGRIRSMKLQFATGPGGSTGGALTITERSSLGDCSIQPPIPAGSTASAIAAAVAAAFQAGGIPGPYPGCQPQSNPRDLTAQGDSIRTALASKVSICVNDPAVGVTILPTEICTTTADCDDANPCTSDTCNVATGLCQHANAPNGQTCDDGNACTVGNTCQNGACGTPVTCNDGNPCTTDSCDPATGACASTPVICDDGNPCTTDTCAAATGGCVFTPTPGAACNDGDLCTTGDTCVLPPAGGPPVCQGTPKCADADPCTADLCDPTTGACSNPPIACDDGNPCTVDSCVGGACVSSPVAGATCDDGNRCTTGDTCVQNPASGIAACAGTPVNCDDGNACTIDSCDPVSGGCGHLPVPIDPVAADQFSGQTTFTWGTVSGAIYYNSYRGTIPANGLGTRLSTGNPYDQTCLEAADSFGDGAALSTDAAVPPMGTAFYYLASEEASCGEGPIGADMNGTLIPNSSPCLAP